MLRCIRTSQKMRRISNIGHTITLLPRFQMSSGMSIGGGVRGCDWEKDENMHLGIVLWPSPYGRTGLVM